MTVETGKSDFDLLLGEISDIAKALPAKGDTADADSKIVDAAEDGEDESDADKDGKVVAKSFKLALADGTEIDAVDGAELFKSLTQRVEKSEISTAAAVRGLIDVVKSFAAELKAVSTKGVGRKTVIAINEKPAAISEEIAKSQDAGMPVREFLAKAFAMQVAGTVDGSVVRRAEAYANAGKTMPADIVTQVLGTK